jgi:Mg2+ and Co2+ transporter CorA
VHDFGAALAQPISIDTTVNAALSPATAHTTDGSVLSPTRSHVSIDSTLRRRPTRSNTVRHYHESPTRKEFEEEPGAEPGADVLKEYNLQQRCDITVVDFSDELVECHELNNDTLEHFLEEPKEDWVGCRWINVNGLSWDVIRALMNANDLHRLAIEDLMERRGRTKADWYSDQAFREPAPETSRTAPY